MQFSGRIQKLVIDQKLGYMMSIGQERIRLNDMLGYQFDMKFLGSISCDVCQELTPKSYQGSCYRCFTLLARNDKCVMNPHLCHFAKGTCREPAWGMTHCMQPHLVYIAWTSGLKIGITKPQNIPSRWLDQGAIWAKILCRVPSRYHAGLIENVASVLR